MLFLGTEKYPDEKEYSDYLQAHGGASNAWTDREDTNYYFDVNWPFLEPALDRFAQVRLFSYYNEKLLYSKKIIPLMRV